MTMDQLVAPSAPCGPGFADPVAQSQRVFRAIMDAMSSPGSLRRVDSPQEVPDALWPASAAVGLALLDHDTSAWLPADCLAARDWLRFHTGCRLATRVGDADFVFVPLGRDCPDFATMKLGSDEEPHRSAMVVIDVAGLEVRDAGWRLTGPGIRGDARLHVEGLARAVLRAREGVEALFPRGVDAILAHGSMLAALPRTTRVEA
jgi:alpha-D-ribose 1-methylphosphonate 5-triphosphate synthase subunit PhnH